MKPRFGRRGVEFALSHPTLALRLASGRLSYEEVLRVLVGKELGFLRSRAGRVLSRSNVQKLSEVEMEKTLQAVSPSRKPFKLLTRWHSFLYAITRVTNPSTVVETGVLYGYSSAAILAALEDNGTGRLISVDLPVEQHRSVTVDGRHIQVGLSSRELSVGCAIPLALRSRWSLRLGNSLELLPSILVETGPISIFIHDSLHTYDHMTAEFRLGYDALNTGGVMASDDIGYNSAWSDFCNLKGENSKAFSKGPDVGDWFALLIKS